MKGNDCSERAASSADAMLADCVKRTFYAQEMKLRHLS